MPELPEVETVVAFLSPALQGKFIRSIDLPNGYSKVIENGNLSSVINAVKGRKIVRLSRRGKYIIFELGQRFLVFHLRMTGKLLLHPLQKKFEKHLSFCIGFKDNSNLYFYDTRKFGRIYFSRTLEWLEEKLGIEPLSKEFNLSWMTQSLGQRKRMMKPLFLDQSYIAGLGNIYIDEILWKASIHPQSISNKIPEQSIPNLYKSIRSILQDAISYNGTTFINFSFGENRTGEYKEKLNVFGKQGQSCPNCEGKIQKIRVGQRGTHICNHCQKLYV
jgi:formamidopyrimidine-DNA glycosylase|tara:strand:- start:96 stop:920 length:825 start_codon:yes stop_codon:yes gene_type:complete